MKATREELKARVARSRQLGRAMERSGDKVVRGLRGTARALRQGAPRAPSA